MGAYVYCVCACVCMRVLLGTEPRALHMLDKLWAINIYTSLLSVFLNQFINFGFSY